MYKTPLLPRVSAAFVAKTPPVVSDQLSHVCCLGPTVPCLLPWTNCPMFVALDQLSHVCCLGPTAPCLLPWITRRAGRRDDGHEDGRRHRVGVAPDETVILLHPPLPLAGLSIAMERARQPNDSLVNGQVGVAAGAGGYRLAGAPAVHSPGNPTTTLSAIVGIAMRVLPPEPHIWCTLLSLCATMAVTRRWRGCPCRQIPARPAPHATPPQS